MPDFPRRDETFALELRRSVGVDGNRRGENSGRAHDPRRNPCEDRRVVRRSLPTERRRSGMMMKKFFSEFLGTFALVFAGTGAIVINDVSGGVVSHVGIALTFGLIILAMVYTLGEISGAHLNPAVTIGFFAAQRFPMRLLPAYILSQLLGAICASTTLRLLFPQDSALGGTHPHGSVLQSFVLEVILTSILMFVILSVSRGANETGFNAGIA